MFPKTGGHFTHVQTVCTRPLLVARLGCRSLLVVRLGCRRHWLVRYSLCVLSPAIHVSLRLSCTCIHMYICTGVLIIMCMLYRDDRVGVVLCCGLPCLYFRGLFHYYWTSRLFMAANFQLWLLLPVSIIILNSPQLGACYMFTQ